MGGCEFQIVNNYCSLNIRPVGIPELERGDFFEFFRAFKILILLGKTCILMDQKYLFKPRALMYDEIFN
jgi:hypothetical protein